MDALIQRYSGSANGFDFHNRSIPVLEDQIHVNGYKSNHSFTDDQLLLSGTHQGDISPSSGGRSEASSPEVESDFSDAFLKYISQMLMEEDLENKTCMYQDCLALQAAEKSFYEVLGEKYPPSPNQQPLIISEENGKSPDDDSSRSWSSDSSTAGNYSAETNWIHHLGELQSPFGQSFPIDNTSQSILQPFGSSNGFCDATNGPIYGLVSPFQVPDSCTENQPIFRGRGGKVTQLLPSKNYVSHDVESKEEPSKGVDQPENNERDHSPNGSRGKKNHHREDGDLVEESRSSKQLANDYAEESEAVLNMFDKVLLCPSLNPGLHDELSNGASRKFQQKSNVGRPRGKKGNQKEVVDLRSLLTQCAQAVSSCDSRTVNELLQRIRQHSSPYGDGGERMAHYFADALEARLAGTGTALYTAFKSRRISAAILLKAYQVYVTACPFNKMSNFFANRTIGKLAMNAKRLHIIDFGILYGFQWPCLIQRLSVRPGGPPTLRITGIDFPQPGFRPAERVAETGHRLSNYCKRFRVPFEYTAIAKKWDAIQLEDLKIDRDEMIVVNCLYRLRNVPDEAVVVNSPRDAVLNLIKRINPDLFIHGVLNGTYNAPFFVTRFREAVFHFSSLFDMFEANAPREDQDRMLYEEEVFGRDIMNVIACEGTERVERPETYKQWQVRNVRAGFRQLSLNQDDVKEVRSRVTSGYHRDFVVDEDSNWMLQGWKGRIAFALSCWKACPEE